jgi:hypothetical protein
MTAQPRRQPHGRTIRCAGGYRAYVPEPLPPRLAWSDTLAAAWSRADLAVGRLAGEGRRRPNPHLLIRPFVRREAVLSSRIEGTQATLGELLAAEAGAAVERSPEDLREVGIRSSRRSTRSSTATDAWGGCSSRCSSSSGRCCPRRSSI